MNPIDDATLDVLAAQATDSDHEPQDRADADADADAVLGEILVANMLAVERIAAALLRIKRCTSSSNSNLQRGGCSYERVLQTLIEGRRLSSAIVNLVVEDSDVEATGRSAFICALSQSRKFR